MNLKQHATILLVVLILVGESRIQGVEEHDQSGEGSLQFHGEEVRPDRRMVHKKGDHLFNNIEKAFTNIIRNVFFKTPLRDFCETRASGNSLIITEISSGNDKSNQFPFMVNAYHEYKTDPLLTTDRDKLSVYGPKKQQGPDKNSKQWGETIENLTRMAMEFIDEFIKAYASGSKTYGNSKRLENIRIRIGQIINKKIYVDKDAKDSFTNDPRNGKMAELVRDVEQRTEEAIRNLPTQINIWAIEAAKFYKKKTSGR